MILTTDTINKLVIDLFKELLGWNEQQFLVETRGGARPSSGKPYMTLWWKNIEVLNQGYGEMRSEEDSDEARQFLENESLCSLQITIYGNDAYNICNEVRMHLESANRFFDLWSVIGFAGCDSVNDLSADFGGHIEQRAFFNFSFYANFGREYPADYFDKSKWVINGEQLTI